MSAGMSVFRTMTLIIAEIDGDVEGAKSLGATGHVNRGKISLGGIPGGIGRDSLLIRSLLILERKFSVKILAEESLGALGWREGRGPRRRSTHPVRNLVTRLQSRLVV